MKSSAVEVVIGELPLELLTVTTTVPAPAGEVALITVSLTTLNFADVAPKSTVEAPVNPDPVMVTEVPPAAGPLVGLRPETTGM